jgi:trigger factor
MADEGVEYLKEMRSPSDLKRILEFEIPRERVQAEIEDIIQGIRREAALPGFRRGKAPLDMIRARFGETARKEAIEKFIPEAYEQALRKQALRPVLPPELSNLTYEDAGPLSFHISIELFPRVDPASYRGVRVRKEIKPVEPGDVDLELEALRERAARFERVEGPTEPKHVAVLDYWRIGEDGNPAKGSRVTGYPVEIGSGKLVKEFDRELVGTKSGDEKTVAVTYPNDFPDEGLRGKTVRFGVVVKEVNRKILPDLNDDFAKLFNVETLDALRADLGKAIEVARERDATSRAKQEIMKTVVVESAFEVPEGLVGMTLDSMMKSYGEDSEARGEAPAEDKPAEKLNEIRERLKPLAVNLVKEQFIIDEIAKRENISAKDEEIEGILEAVAARGGISLEDARSRAAKSDEPSRWRRDIIRNKVLDFLYQNADVQS